MQTATIFIVAVMKRKIHRKQNRNVTTSMNVVDKLELVLFFEFKYLEFSVRKFIGIHGKS